MAFPALLDACALYGATLCDVFLRLADAGAFRPLWSEQILEEVRRNVAEHHGPSVDVERRLHAMRDYFPDAMVSGYENLIERMTCHPHDRHVLAAAVRADAAVLVTFNVRDFPPESVAPFDVEVVHPDDFLLDQLDLFPGIVVAVVRSLLEIYDNPPLDLDGLADVLIRSGVPRFAQELPRYFD